METHNPSTPVSAKCLLLPLAPFR
uniref:Uncharacterized protein n=1 Tax=Anguilla anguilla TaxID=7936 RepID=A0A0E9SZM3_ANGAN